MFLPFESPYMAFYLTSIDTFSLSCTVPEIFDFRVFRVRPGFSTLKGHVRSKMFSPFESPYVTSCLTSIDTFSLSRTVPEIFDFKVFRVRPWLSTLKDHVRSNMFLLFESTYMTSYLTSIDTFSLSCTVPEICDFKVFRVRLWLSTLKGHVRSKLFSPFKSPYVISCLISIDTFSLSRTVPEIFDIEMFKVRPWLSTLKITRGQKYFRHSKAHTWLPISLPLTLSLYLVAFLRYLTSKFLGFDLDFRPLNVTWGRNCFRHSKAHTWLPV